MKKYISIVFFIVFMAIISSFVFGESFAKYASSISGDASIGVAKPIYRNNVEEIIVPLSSMKPGETFTYNFYIVNEDTESSLAEVTLNYSMRIERSTNLPVTVNLYEYGQTTNLLDSDLTTAVFTLPCGIRTIHNYTVSLSWDASYDDYRWNNVIEAMIIYIDVVQASV